MPWPVELFSTVETGDKGRLLLYSADWDGNDDERVVSLGLNYEIARLGPEAALLVEVQSAVQREAPVLAWLYEPHWAPVRFDGEYVELPPFTAECEESGLFNFEKPQGEIIKISWPGMEEKWPAAFGVIEAFTLSNEEYGAVIVEADLNGASIDDLVALRPRAIGKGLEAGFAITLPAITLNSFCNTMRRVVLNTCRS